MHYLLALETSSSVCGVALACFRPESGLERVRSLSHDATAEHAERLLPMVDELLAAEGIVPADLAAVAFGQGPGGFTGLRVACGVAQGLAFGLDISVVPVDSLLALVQRAQGAVAGSALCLALQDARMGEVYAAVYARQAGDAVWQACVSPVLLDAAQVAHWLQQERESWPMPWADQPVIVHGDALAAYPDMLHGLRALPWLAEGQPIRADAGSVAELACRRWLREGGLAPELAAPLYVRDKVAFTTRERELGQGGNPRAGRPPVLEAMTASHLAQVSEIERRVQSFPWTSGNFADALRAGYGAWVLRREEDVLAFCVVMFAPDIAHLLVIGVKPEHQGQGLGRRLMAHIEREVRSRSLPAVLLEVRPSNSRAVAFYERLGFATVATRRNYYPAPHGAREDAIVMQKALP